MSQFEDEKFRSSNQYDMMASQSISLKRIADALEKLTKPPVMAELTPEQIKDLESEWKNAGYMMYKR